jgi:LPS-assembly protein
LEGQLSDIVGAISINPGQNFRLDYKTRLDKDNFGPRRNEVRLFAGPQAFNGVVNYVFFDNRSDSEFSSREEIALGLNARFNRFWRGNFAGRHDLGENGGLRSVGAALIYEDECFIFDISASRQFYVDRDLQPDDRIMLQLTFKTLGEVRTGIL